ncbi:hypothetical protein ABK040_002672 [Willaertia magna]
MKKSSSTDFALQGFETEREEIDDLVKEYKEKIDEFITTNGLSLDKLLSCPLGVSYFYRFLSSEYNKENLLCYYELISLSDYLRYANEKIAWIVDTKDLEEKEDNTTPSTPHFSVCSLEETQECVRRVKQFKDAYFEESSPYEVNVSGEVKKVVTEALTFNPNKYKETPKYSHLKDVIPDITCKTEEKNSPPSAEKCDLSVEYQLENVRLYVKQVDEGLDILKQALSLNLLDPFNRYCNSDLMYESLALFFSSKGDDSYHRKRILEANDGEGVVLNQGVGALGNITELSSVHPLTKITELLAMLREALNKTTDFYLIDTEKSSSNMKDDSTNMLLDLNYDEFGDNSTCTVWTKFKHEAHSLAFVNLDLLKTDEEKIAFFINAYNMLLIHAVIVAGSLPQVEITNVMFYRRTRYNIGGHLFSLQDIFGGILQANIMRCLIYGRAFKKDDPRLKYIPSATFPEAYFGLINLSKYSPRLQIYSPLTLASQLKQNTEDYFTRYVQTLSNPSNTNEITEVALPVTLKEQKSELKNFCLSEHGLDNTSTELRRLSEVSAEGKKNVLNYLIEHYSNDLKGKKLSSNTKFTYKPNSTEVPNYFVVFTLEFEKDIKEKFKIDAPASSEVLLPQKAKEKECGIEKLVLKVKSRYQQYTQEKTEKKEKKTCGRKRSPVLWKGRLFQKKEVSVTDYILQKPSQKRCVIF